MDEKLEEALRIRAMELGKNVADLHPDEVTAITAEASEKTSFKESTLLDKALKIRAIQLCVNPSDLKPAEVASIKLMVASDTFPFPKKRKSKKVQKPSFVVVDEPVASVIDNELAVT